MLNKEAFCVAFMDELAKIAQGLGSAPKASLYRRLTAPLEAKARGRIGQPRGFAQKFHGARLGLQRLTAPLTGAAGQTAGMIAAQKAMEAGQPQQEQGYV